MLFSERIEATRFELAASASRTLRSTKLSHASINMVYLFSELILEMTDPGIEPGFEP